MRRSWDEGNEGASGARSAALDYQSERHCAKTKVCISSTTLVFDYQSERHYAKTIGAKSPLRGMFILTDSVSSVLKKLQFNRSFALVFILRLIVLIFKKEHAQFREKSVSIEL